MQLNSEKRMSHCLFICHTLLLAFVFAAFHFRLTKCDAHIYSLEKIDGDVYVFLEHQLFSRNCVDARDYSIYFKYRADSMHGMVAHAVLNTTASSNGTMRREWSDYDDNRVLEAVADIQNASKFEVDIKVNGIMDNVERMGYLLTDITPRSFAIMCEAGLDDRRMRRQRILEYGRRVDGDFLIRFERHEVKRKGSRFPSHEFEFYDADVGITYVKLAVDSPTAVVFSNKVQLEKCEFKGKIYGTDFISFTAEMHVYGVKHEG